MREYYKKIDKSVFNYGITIPKDRISDFLFDVEIPLGTGHDLTIEWKSKEYLAKISHVNRTHASSVYQIRWDNNKELLTALKKEFIQSYIAIESQNFEANKQDKYYITKLLGGNQEVLIFRPKTDLLIELETFIKVDTPYGNLFERLVEENVFGWLSKDIKKDILITKSTTWIDISDLFKHENTAFVIYYLLDETKKEIYIGSATRLGDRVKPMRNEIPGWHKFRYEIIHPEYHHLLRSLEYHSIMNFARFFNSNGRLSTLGCSDFKLVNKDYKFYQK